MTQVETEGKTTEGTEEGQTEESLYRQCATDNCLLSKNVQYDGKGKCP